MRPEVTSGPISSAATTFLLQKKLVLTGRLVKSVRIVFKFGAARGGASKTAQRDIKNKILNFSQLIKKKKNNSTIIASL